MGALQNAATIIGLLSGLVGLFTAAYGLFDKFRTAGKKPAPVAAGPYPSATRYAPPYPAPSYPYPQQQQQQIGMPPPGGGYGAPPPQWGYPARPVAPPMAPAQAYYAPYPAQPAVRHWFTYPWILLGAAGFFIFSAIYSNMVGSSSSPTDVTSAIILILAWVVYLPTVIFAARHAVRLKRWGWLVSIIVLFGYGVLAFGLFGPTTRPGQR